MAVLACIDTIVPRLHTSINNIYLQHGVAAIVFGECGHGLKEDIVMGAKAAVNGGEDFVSVAVRANPRCAAD